MSRFVVVGRKGSRRIYTDALDAMAVAKRCSRTKRGTICRVCEGPRGAERVVMTCSKNKCDTPSAKQPKMCFPRAPLRKGDVAHLGGTRRRKRRK
jgi:hypothetical protein